MLIQLKNPTHITLPSVTQEDYLNQSAIDTLSILQSTPSVLVALEYSDKIRNALEKIAELLGRATIKPTIFLPVATATPTMPHISLPVKSHMVPVPLVFPRVPYQRVTAL